MTRRSDYLDRLFTRPDWMNNPHPCDGATDLFYFTRAGDNGRAANNAKAICRGCSDRLKCLQYAIDNNEDFGVWGGHTVRERRQIARNQRALGWQTGRYRQVKIEGEAS